MLIANQDGGLSKLMPLRTLLQTYLKVRLAVIISFNSW
jgi:hypothetical protein